MPDDVVIPSPQPSTSESANTQRARSLLAALLAGGDQADPNLATQLADLEATAPGTVLQAAVNLGAERLESTAQSTEAGQTEVVDQTLASRYGLDQADIAHPASLAEALALIGQAAARGASVRAVGSARSLSDAPDPGDNTTMISTAAMWDPIPIDPELLLDPSAASSLYACGSGRTVKAILGDLDPYPDDPTKPMAYTLKNLGAGQFQAVVGALATSTHGSGITMPSFPQLVAALEIATVDAEGAAVARRLEPSPGEGAITDPAKWAASGTPVALVQDSATFNAALVSVGSLGVITAVTLRLVPGFYLEEHRDVVWWSQIRDSLGAMIHENDYFELVFDPLPATNEQGQPDYPVLTSRRNVVPGYAPSTGRPLLMKIGTTELGRITSAVLLEWAIRDPGRRVPFNLRSGVKGSAVADYIDKNYRVLQLNMDVNADSTEQNVPAEAAVEAIEAVLAYTTANYQALLQRFPADGGVPFDTDPEGLKQALRTLPLPTSPLGIRFVPANDAPMSPMYQRATMTMEFPMPGSDFLDRRAAADAAHQTALVQLYDAYLDGRRKLFQDVEALLQREFAARPHWGQANFLDREQLIAQMPGFPAWLAVYQEYNPIGTFNGAFTDRLGISVHAHHHAAPQPGAPVTGVAIFRHQRSADRGILKLKGDVGWAIYNALTNPVAPDRCELLFPKKCKRMGLSLIASTQNLVDPVVAELRFSPQGAILSRTDDWDLYHSLSPNRQYGTASFDGALLRITGDAATGLRAFVDAGRDVAGEPDAPDTAVVLRVVDLASGHWEVVSI